MLVISIKTTEKNPVKWVNFRFSKVEKYGKILVKISHLKQKNCQTKFQN